MMQVNVHISNDALEKIKKCPMVGNFLLIKTIFRIWTLSYNGIILAFGENAEQILMWCDLNGFDSSEIKPDHSLFDWYKERLHS